MIEKLSESDLSFLETYFYSIAAAETLFSDYDNLTVMKDDTLAHVRLGQIPLLSHEYILADDPKLTDKENFQLRKGAGDCYALGGRLFGKTLFVEKIDFLVSVSELGAEKCGFSSYDAIHIRGVLEEVIQCLENHPFFQLYEARITRSPSYSFFFKSGYSLEGINMNITGKKPGAQFFQKHLTRLYMEEASFETEQIFNQRRDSVSEDGCIFRMAGMTNFTKYTPCGKIFYDYSKKGHIVNLPQYVNPKWDEKKKMEAIKDFGGEQSLNYRVFVKGEVVEDGVSVFDMVRVRKNYDEDRQIKTFEIPKELFPNFQDIIFVEKPKNATITYIFADIGESAPTEIGIVFQIGKNLRYEYNITLYNLTDKEQFKIFEWLGRTLEANFIAIDCTDGTGRAIFRSLEQVFPKENLQWVAFNEKVDIDFERNPTTNEIIFEDGQPVYREELVRNWSIKHLKDLLYSDIMDLPMDYKLDQQLNSVIAKQSKATNQTLYACVCKEDHLFQAFQVFSIAHWINEFSLTKPIKSTKFFKFGV